MVGYTGTVMYDSQCHFHNAWELICYVSGNGHFCWGEKSTPFNPGTIAIIPPQVPHYQDSESGFMSYYVMFEQSSNNQNEVRIYNDHNGYIKPLLETLYAFVYSFQPNRFSISEATLSLIAQYLVSYEMIVSEHKDNHIISPFLSVLASQFNSPSFDMKAAIDNVPYSGDYFRRLFKKETGLSPAQYLNSLRIEFARQLLEESSMSIKSISTMSGFSDPYYFPRQFKSFHGINPKGWRKNFTQKKQDAAKNQMTERANEEKRGNRYNSFTVWTQEQN